MKILCYMHDCLISDLPIMTPVGVSSTEDDDQVLLQCSICNHRIVIDKEENEHDNNNRSKDRKNRARR